MKLEWWMWRSCYKCFFLFLAPTGALCAVVCKYRSGRFSLDPVPDPRQSLRLTAVETLQIHDIDKKQGCCPAVRWNPKMHQTCLVRTWTRSRTRAKDEGRGRGRERRRGKGQWRWRWWCPARGNPNRDQTRPVRTWPESTIRTICSLLNMKLWEKVYCTYRKLQIWPRIQGCRSRT